jgi:hypothetical protein
VGVRGIKQESISLCSMRRLWQYRRAVKMCLLIITTILSLTLSHNATARPNRELEQDAQVVLAKARSLRLPSIEFRGATLREAVEVLVEQGREIDTGGKGVNVIIELNNISRNASPIPSITFSLQDVTLFQAVTAVAQQAGLSVRAESYGLVIYRKTNQGH